MKLPLGLMITLAGVAIVAAMGFGVYWWWQQNAEQLKESAKAAYLDGQRAGVSSTSGAVLPAHS